MKKLFIIFAFLFGCFAYTHNASATAYYIDLSIGGASCGNDGLATTTAFCSLDQFTEAARAAGDIAFVRRGTSTSTGMTALGFTSSGNDNNPIFLSADYDNLWSDFATSAQSWTVVNGSTTITADAAIAGITAGDWIYVAGDCYENYAATTFNPCSYAYEVRTVRSTSIDLYIAYKGVNSGSGKTVRILPDNPVWGNSANTAIVSMNGDTNWYIKGLRFDGAATGGVFSITTSIGWIFEDMILIVTDGAGAQEGFNIAADAIHLTFNKARLAIGDGSVFDDSADTYGILKINNSIISNSDGSGALDMISLDSVSYFNVIITDTEFQHTGGGGTINIVSIADPSRFSCRNCVNRDPSITQWIGGVPDLGLSFNFEDFNGTLGDNRSFSFTVTDELETISSTSTLRSGGGPNSIQVQPTTDIENVWSYANLLLFEYPIYTNTTSKTYSMFFRVATNTAEFTTDPTADELWIEAEFLDYPANGTSTRRIIKSTGTINFSGSANWQSLSVTAQPTNAGILYLRGWYGKPQEAGQSNQFLIDSTPTIQ